MTTAVLNSKSIRFKNALHWLTGLSVLGVLTFGVVQSVHSSLFYLHNVKLEPMSPGYPLAPKTALDLARVPVGSVSLFDLNMAPIEARLMADTWVKGVILGKQFPNTLSLKIVERLPVALLSESNGRVLYLEGDGTTFEDQAMVYPKELPILTGFKAQNIEELKKVNHFIATWFAADHIPGLKLSSINDDEKMGLRAVISYPMRNQKQMRAVLEMGMNVEEASLIPVTRLKKVLDYLSEHSMPASKIWLGDGKKIIVKISRGP